MRLPGLSPNHHERRERYQQTEEACPDPEHRVNCKPWALRATGALAGACFVLSIRDWQKEVKTATYPNVYVCHLDRSATEALPHPEISGAEWGDPEELSSAIPPQGVLTQILHSTLTKNNGAR